MALLDTDYWDNCVSLTTSMGGNGDYYIQIWDRDENGYSQMKGFRACMSGGPIKSSRLKIAFAELYRAMEEEGLNELPE